MSFLTNIETELQHTLFCVTFGQKLYLAPIGPNIHNVLDIATGKDNKIIVTLP
jgi:hypothetical protein